MTFKKFLNKPSIHYAALAVILAATFVMYYPVFNNNLLKTWDDNRYIINNPLIRTLEAGNLAKIFSSYYDGHYHPLTLISLAIDFQSGGTSPLPYHRTNLLLHLINTFLVFLFVRLLCRRRKPWFALATSLLFGISTMGVESVAWASERKNLLYALFFLLSLIAYLMYLQKSQNKWYVFSLLMFVLSVLSKVTAVSLVLTLPVIDLFYKRHIKDKKVILEKLPFLVIAIISGVVAIMAQQSSWGENLSQEHISFMKRLFLGGYSYVEYIVKIIVPAGLSGFYPYPAKFTGVLLTKVVINYILLIIIAVVFFKNIKKAPVFIFSVLFYTANIFFLLKIFDVPAGDYFMADRYAYIASIGVFISIVYGIDILSEKFEKIKPVLIIAFLFYVSAITYQTYQRTLVWQDDISFYTDIINKQPSAAVAYLNRGALRKQKGDLQGAESDLLNAVRLQSGNYKNYANLGAVYLEAGIFQKAIKNYEKANALKHGNRNIVLNLGVSKLRAGDNRGAIAVFDSLTVFAPDFADAYSNRGTAKYKTGDIDGAIADYRKAVSLDSTYQFAWYNLALAKLNKNDYDGAIEAFNRLIEINPDYSGAYANRAVAWSGKGIMNKAFADYNKALELNPGNFEVLLNRGIDYFNTGDYQKAIEDLSRAITINTGLAPAYYFRGLAGIAINKKEIACKDLQMAYSLGFTAAVEKLQRYCQ